MEKINIMKDIFQGPVYDFLINESLNNRMGWGGNAGSIDGVSETDLENSKRGNDGKRTNGSGSGGNFDVQQWL